jgi:hypothetical protein
MIFCRFEPLSRWLLLTVLVLPSGILSFVRTLFPELGFAVRNPTQDFVSQSACSGDKPRCRLRFAMRLGSVDVYGHGSFGFSLLSRRTFEMPERFPRQKHENSFEMKRGARARDASGKTTFEAPSPGCAQRRPAAKP